MLTQKHDNTSLTSPMTVTEPAENFSLYGILCKLSHFQFFVDVSQELENISDYLMIIILSDMVSIGKICFYKIKTEI